MRRTLGLGTKLLYGVGDSGLALTNTTIGAYFAIYLTDVVGVGAGIVGIALFVGKSWDYLNDPLIGHLSDRTRTRWGRRRPFLLFGALPFAVAFALLWWAPPWQSDVVVAIYFALVFILFDTAATFVYMPYYTLTPELTADYDERTSLTSFRMFFSLAAILIAFTLPASMIGEFNPDSRGRVLRMGIIFGIASAIPLLLTFVGTRERKEYVQAAPPTLRESLKSAVKNRPFMFSMGLFLMTYLAVGIAEATLLYFIKYGLGREAQSDMIMGGIFVVAILSLPLWYLVAKRLDKRIAYVIGISFWAVVQLVMISLTPAASMTTVLILAALAGIGIGAAQSIPWAIIPDAIEYDELRTGERHEGMYYSLVTLLQKISASIFIPLVLIVLEVAGYVPAAAQQSAEVVRAIRIVFGPVTAVALLGGIAFAILYPLKREDYAAVVDQLEARRETAR